MWGSYLETRITYIRSWSQTICYKLYVILGKQTMELFFLGHSNLYRLTSCDIPSSNLVIYSKCFFFSFNVKKKLHHPKFEGQNVLNGNEWHTRCALIAWLAHNPWNWCELPPYYYYFQYITSIFQISSWFDWIPFMIFLPLWLSLQFHWYELLYCTTLQDPLDDIHDKF